MNVFQVNDVEGEQMTLRRVTSIFDGKEVGVVITVVVTGSQEKISIKEEKVTYEWCKSHS